MEIRESLFSFFFENNISSSCRIECVANAQRIASRAAPMRQFFQPGPPALSPYPSLSLPLLIDWQAFCSPVRPTECLLVRKCVNLQGNLICVCGLCEGTWILNGNFDSLREIPMNYELYLCVLAISILFVTVGIPNLINYIYIYISYVCVCVLSVLLLWRFVCTNRSKTAQKTKWKWHNNWGWGINMKYPPNPSISCTHKSSI